MLSLQQRDVRRGGITATAVTAIVALNPYRTALDVYLELACGQEQLVNNPRVRWGNILERPIREDYANRHEVRIEVPGTIEHPACDWHLATPDGIIYYWGQPAPDRGLEIKTHSSWYASDYGEPGSDQVPAHELIQCAWNMHVTGLPRWDLVVFMDGLPTEYVIWRDEELEAMLVDAADRFWHDHVKAQVPPPPDGSERYTQWLTERWPKHKKGEIEATEEALAACDVLRRCRATRREAERLETEAEQRVKQAMAEAEALRCQGGRITWRQTKDRTNTDWRGVADALVALVSEQGMDVDVKALIADHTTTKPGARRFTVPRSWDKE